MPDQLTLRCATSSLTIDRIRNSEFVDGECHAAKYLMRRLKRTYLAASRRSDAVVTTAAAAAVIKPPNGSPAAVSVASKVASYDHRHVYGLLPSQEMHYMFSSAMTETDCAGLRKLRKL